MIAILNMFMAIAGLAYVGSAVGWWLTGNRWMAATFALYALTIATLYLAGKS